MSYRKKLLLFLLLILFQSVSQAGNESQHFPLSIRYDGEYCYVNSENRIMQSFYIEKNKKDIWYSYDTLNRNMQIIELIRKNVVLNKYIFQGENSIGHLDSFFVDGSVIWATDTYKKPSVVRLINGIIDRRLQYPFKIFGNQVLAINRNAPSDFVLWASDNGKEKNIFLGRFNKKKTEISSLKKTTINFPGNAILQGLAYNGKNIYALTGETNKQINLYRWDITQGGAEKIYTLVFDLKSKEHGYIEPEGLQLVSFNNEEYLYIGFVIKNIINGKKLFSNCLANFNTSNL